MRMTLEERHALRAQQEAEAKAYFERLFPPPIDATRMTHKEIYAIRHSSRGYRPAAEYNRALDILCGNITLDDDELDRNIARASIAVLHKKGGAA